MERKENSSVGSGAQDTTYQELAFEDKYTLLKTKYDKLRRQLSDTYDEKDYWKCLFLEKQAENELLKERPQEALNHAL